MAAGPRDLTDPDRKKFFRNRTDDPFLFPTELCELGQDSAGLAPGECPGDTSFGCKRGIATLPAQARLQLSDCALPDNRAAIVRTRLASAIFRVMEFRGRERRSQYNVPYVRDNPD